MNASSKQPTIRLVISADQVRETIKALEASSSITPNALAFLHYLKKKELEIQLGLAKANYVPIAKNEMPSNSAIHSHISNHLNNQPMIVTPSNVADYCQRIKNGEVISLSPADMAEVTSFASIMGIELPKGE